MCVNKQIFTIDKMLLIGLRIIIAHVKLSIVKKSYNNIT